MSLRALVLLVVALLLGVGAGYLTFVGAKGVAPALLAGAAAFGASLKLLHELVE